MLQNPENGRFSCISYQCRCQGLETQGRGQGQGLELLGQGQGQELGPALIHTFLVGREQEVMSLVV